MGLILLNSIDDLKKVLVIQQAITRQAETEIDALIKLKPAQYVAAAKRLLKKYAGYPTFTEFADKPDLANSYKWGATIGVAALLGGLVIRYIQHLQPKFAPIVHTVFLITLMELSNPTHTSLLAALEDKIGHAFPSQSLRPLLETVVVVSASFGLMSNRNKNATLTLTGQRVLLHWADIECFIDEVTEAQRQFRITPDGEPIEEHGIPNNPPPAGKIGQTE